MATRPMLVLITTWSVCILLDAVSTVTEYTKIGGDEELPLGEEFQEHLKRFLRPSEKKVPKKIELVRKIVDQLA